MKSFAAILAIAGVAAAQTTAVPNTQVASCASNYQICSASGTVAATCDQQRTNCVTSCQTKYDACRAPGPAGSANQAQCAAEYASCLGTNPFTGPASGDAAAQGVTTVTEVVSSYTTYCPGATSVVQNGQTYVATGPTVLTITNCPCTVTRAVTSVPTNPAAATTPVTNVATGKTGGNNTTPSYTPVAYKGDAAKMVGAGLSFAAAGAGALAFFL
ncbi:hypothetical protein C1H76_6511 [Elsinoe australis]|uniref:Uncharacterized protein n=1 Tax=Elsinoe australis TaxID=40998 RepID=A0A4U7B290_9PEZI|nr:hypothetical protein C1H76_6511 [Elsinoe australis]